VRDGTGPREPLTEVTLATPISERRSQITDASRKKLDLPARATVDLP
jgi:hypothetical protein